MLSFMRLTWCVLLTFFISLWINDSSRKKDTKRICVTWNEFQEKMKNGFDNREILSSNMPLRFELNSNIRKLTCWQWQY